MDASKKTKEATDSASGNPGSTTTTTSLASSNDPNLDPDDDGRDRKEKATSTATSNDKTAASRPRPPPRFEEECPVCLDPLQVDVTAFYRMVCCGQGMHKHCNEGINKSSNDGQAKDHLCYVPCRISKNTKGSSQNGSRVGRKRQSVGTDDVGTKLRRWSGCQAIVQKSSEIVQSGRQAK